MRHAKPGYFMCADCRHERDLLTNISRTISGKVYCGGCATKKHRFDRVVQQAVECEASARNRQRPTHLA